MKKLTVILACAGSLLGQSAHAAESTVYASNNRWSIFKYDDKCALATQSDSGNLSVMASKMDAYSTVYVGNDAWKSLKDGEKQQITITLLKGDKLDEGWGSAEALALTEGIKPSLRFRLNRDDLLTDLATGSVIGFYKGEVLIEGFSLTDSAPMVAKFRQCIEAVEREHPGDPFAN